MAMSGKLVFFTCVLFLKNIDCSKETLKDIDCSKETLKDIDCSKETLKDIDCSKETLKDITSGFLRVLNECKHELNLPEHIVADFYHYWKEDYALLNRDMGCAILCMSKKLDLIDETGKLHHGNTQEFAEKHGADNSMASKLVEILHECERNFETMEDDCARVLEVAKCFRSTIHKLGWAPTINVIIEEVLTEI